MTNSLKKVDLESRIEDLAREHVRELLDLEGGPPQMVGIYNDVENLLIDCSVEELLSKYKKSFDKALIDSNLPIPTYIGKKGRYNINIGHYFKN